MTQDIRFAARLVARAPAIFLATLAGVALAIGLSTAVFSVVNGSFLRGSGISDSVSVFHLSDAPSYREYVRLAGTVKSLSLTAEANSTYVNLDYAAETSPKSEGAHVGAVTGNYFSVLGGETSLGRPLTPSDDRPGAPAVAVVSHPFWKSRLGSDPRIVGRTVQLGDTRFTVVGVAARGFAGTDYGIPPAFWIPFGPYTDIVRAGRTTPFDSGVHPMNVTGRLAPGVTADRAAAELTILRNAIDREFRGASAKPMAIRLRSADAGESRIFIVAAVMAVLALLLLVAGCNVAILLLASAAGRRREIATRLAIGATSGRVARQMLTESVLVGVVGGALGLLVATWLTPIVAVLVRVPPVVDVAPDVNVYAFTAGVIILIGIAAGLAPARYARGGDLLSSLKSDPLGAGGAARPSRLRAVLVGGQAMASLVLLVTTALLTRGFLHASTLDTGIHVDRLMNVSASPSGGTVASRIAFLPAALDRIRAVPGVESAALAAINPFSDGMAGQRVSPDAGDPSRYPAGAQRGTVNRNETSSEFFETLGIRLQRGRVYSEEERRAGAPVAVISDSLARVFWGDANPVGSSLERVWGADDKPGGPVKGLMRKPSGTRVIGVVTDTTTRLRDQQGLTIYLPMGAETIGAARIVVRTTGDPAAIAGMVRSAVRTVDQRASVTTSLPREGLRTEMEGPQSLAALSAMLGTCALVLAVVGLFGVTAFAVVQRQYELNVRLVLGAEKNQLVTMIVRDVLKPVLVGLAAGIVLALFAGNVMRAALYGVSGHDPIAFAAAIVVLLGAAVAAAFGPARRALRLDPAQMMKQS